MKKLLFIPLLLIIAFLPVVSGLEVIADSYDYGAYATVITITATHPSATSAKSAWGQSFRSYFDGANVTCLQLYAYQTSATGTCTAKICGHSGTFGTTGVPNATVYATSDAVQITAGSVTVTNFTFASGYILDSSQDYFWTVEGTAGDVATESFGTDNAAPVFHRGNAAYYASSTWTYDATQDLIFYLYASDGTAVSFGQGGDIFINEITEVHNVTATGDVTATGTVTAGNVSAGDVSAGAVSAGAVTATGDLTASFNNTAVTAGDVQASGTVTVAGGVTVNGTFDNATLVMDSSTISADMQPWTLIVILILLIGLAVFPRIPLLNFVAGIVGIAFTAITVTSSTLAYQQMFGVMLGLVSMVCIFRGGLEFRSR